MDLRYNVSQLFQLAFGINMPVYLPYPLTKELPPNISFDGIETRPEFNPSNSKSWMGTPIMFELSFIGNEQKYKKYTVSGEVKEIALPNYTLPPATMFQFRRAKNVTRTNVLGSNGTVKEIFGFDDWVIDVKGLCLDEPNRSAISQLEELLKWEELADSIAVSGEVCNMMDINRVCISEFSHNIVQGSNGGVIAYEMQLFSDDPAELIMNL